MCRRPKYFMSSSHDLNVGPDSRFSRGIGLGSVSTGSRSFLCAAGGNTDILLDNFIGPVLERCTTERLWC